MNRVTKLLALLALVVAVAVAPGCYKATPDPETKSREAVRFDGNSNAATFGVLMSDGVTPMQARMDARGAQYVTRVHPAAFSCVLTTAATTSTQITGCEVVAGKSYIITDVVIAREAANAVGTPTILQSGTSTACTGPHILLSTYGVALTTTPISLQTPIVATAAEGLCILDGTAGTKKITVTGLLL